jgi:metal-dependent amidase/aminoacylase/carboxypeptidase family protein
VGSPAEESYGGKITLLEHGALEGIDFAMMAHGGFVNLPSRNMLGRKKITIEFRGRSSSAGLEPHLGLSALDAIVQTYATVAMMRHQLRFGAKVSGIITHGGQSAHLIPDYTRGEFLIRTPESAYMDELERRLLDCARGAALATGTTMEFQVSDRNYTAMNRNAALEDAYERNLRFIGEHVDIWPADAPMGSTDFANVSNAIPAIHSYFKMVPQEIDHHTPEYALASKSPAGIAGMLAAAKAMALTGLDLALDPELRRQIQKDFQRAKEPLPGTRSPAGLIT